MTLGLRPPLALALPAIAGALLMLAQAASAQQEAPKASESLERAQKAADAVFHWIKLNADKGASREKPAAAPTPAPAPARKPAPAPVAAAPKPAAAAAPSAAPAPVPAPTATAAAPAPTAVAAAPQAAPEPEPELERAPVVLASAAPTPAPAAPMAAAARAAEPPPKPVEEAEEPLKLLAKVEPIIPRQMQQQGNFRSGFAQVQFTVGTDGSVQQASVIKASHNRLGTAAVDAVKQWRFAPLRKAREAAVEVAFKSDSD